MTSERHDGPTGERNARARRWAAGALLALLTAASALVFELRGRVPFTSDQAIVALMAQDIQKGAHPVFYYGSEYAGTFEPHYLALLFPLFGPSVATFRAGMLLFVVGTVALVAGIGRQAYGERAGWLAGLYLALGPAFFLYKGLTSDGAYTSLLLVLAAGLALLLAIDERLARGADAGLLFALLGLTFGLAWWIHSLAVCLVPVALLACFVGVPGEWRRPRALLPLGASFFAASAPWWWRNGQTGWASLRSAEMAPASGQLVARVRQLFSHGWTNLLGGRLLWRRSAFTFPGAGLASLLVLALAVGFGIWMLRGNAPRRARLASALFLTLLVTLVLLSLGVARTNFKEPRYLLPAYLALAPLLGGLLAALWPRRTLFALLALLLLALGPGSELAAPHLAGREMTYFVSDPQQVIAGLTARGIHEVYASYWVAYRLDFLSQGRVTASPFGNSSAGLVRVPALSDRLDRVPDPAYLLCCEDLPRFREWLAHDGIAHREEPLSGFSLFTGLPAAAVAGLRRCGCIPEARGRIAVSWLSVDGPHHLTAGEEALYRVTFYNRGRRPFSSNVHLSYHWLRPDGSVARFDGLRSDLPRYFDDWWRLPNWRTVEVPVEVKADLAPGDYVLDFDLVDENVAWFQDKGTPPAPYRVVVEAAAPAAQ